MRLMRQKLCLVLLAAAFGCRNATEQPSSEPISGLFILESVDGRPLPTIIDAGAGDTTTILQSSVTLDPAGRAVTVHHLSHVYLQFPAEETIYTLRQAYRTKGDSIEIGGFEPCPPAVLCAANLHGSFTQSSLAIAERYDPYPRKPIIYLYRLVETY